MLPQLDGVFILEINLLTKFTFLVKYYGAINSEVIVSHILMIF